MPIWGVRGGHVGHTLRRGAPQLRSLLEGLAALHCWGQHVQWERVYPAGQVAELPPAAWQRRRHWLDARPAAAAAVPGGRGVVMM
ncbi:hypothetical protein GCM10020000_84760 [Streptomyces olivoverticillatus]